MSLFDAAANSDLVEDQVQPIAVPTTYMSEEGLATSLISNDSPEEEIIPAQKVGSKEEATCSVTDLEMIPRAEYGLSDPAVNQFCEIAASIVARVAYGTPSDGEGKERE